MKLHVGNLSRETTEPQLRETFEKYGAVTAVTVVVDKSDGKSKGFGFVEMNSEENGKSAITGLHGKELGGNMLNVSEARKSAPATPAVA